MYALNKRVSTVWAVAIGKPCARDPANIFDRYVVAMLGEESYDHRCDLHSGIYKPQWVGFNPCSGKKIGLNIHTEKFSL